MEARDAMDEELRRYLDGMMAQINDKFGRVLDRVGALERDFQNTKEFLVGDVLVSGRRRSGRRRMDAETLLTQVEEQMRRLRGEG